MKTNTYSPVQEKRRSAWQYRWLFLASALIALMVLTSCGSDLASYTGNPSEEVSETDRQAGSDPKSALQGNTGNTTGESRPKDDNIPEIDELSKEEVTLTESLVSDPAINSAGQEQNSDPEIKGIPASSAEKMEEDGGKEVAVVEEEDDNDNKKEEVVYDETLTGKYICLTFDDGPASNNTPKVLKALKEYDAKATFFVCGPDTTEMRKMIRQEAEDGHAVGIHCYSHKLTALYKSEESFFTDFDKIESIVIEETGQNPILYRFPGGTSNGYITKALSDTLILKLKEKGYEYYDWNVGSKDDSRPPAEEIADNVINGCLARAKAATPSIVLIHDSAGRYTSADAVPVILKTLSEKGFKFISLSHKVVPAHFQKR